MLSIESLREFGADVDEAILRCMNNVDFYLMLVKKVLNDTRIYQLEEQISDKNLEAAFETAHTLKGMFSNLSLTPLVRPITAISENLKNKVDMDYRPLLEEAKSEFRKLKNL